MTPLLEFRNEFGDEEQDRERRSFRKMGGFLQGSFGRLHHGPYKKEIREAWLERLLRMQEEIKQEGPEGFDNVSLTNTNLMILCQPFLKVRQGKSFWIQNG